MSRQKSGGYAGARARAKSEYRHNNFLCIGCGKKICRCLSLRSASKETNICCEVPSYLRTPGEVANGINPIIPLSWLKRREKREGIKRSFKFYKQKGLTYNEARKMQHGYSNKKVYIPTREEYEAM